MANNKRTAAEIASELLVIRHQKNELIKADKDLSDELRKRIKKGEVQDAYKIRTDYALDISDVTLATNWAREHQCVKVDVPAVDSWIKNNRHSIPEGFTLVEKEKLVEIISN